MNPIRTTAAHDIHGDKTEMDVTDEGTVVLRTEGVDEMVFDAEALERYRRELDKVAFLLNGLDGL